MKLTYYGHSCFAVQSAHQTLLFDPFISGNALARQIDLEHIPADVICISHAHEDHLADAVALARRTRARVIANYEIYVWLTRQGIETAQPVNHGGSVTLPAGRLKLVNAVHSSSFPDGSYGGNPGGWVLESPKGSFYYSGDTALTADMRLIGESTRLDFAVLCVGDTFTMGIEDAIRAADLVGCTRIVGVHYDTFPPICIDHAEAVRKFKDAGKELHLLPIGESMEF